MKTPFVVPGQGAFNAIVTKPSASDIAGRCGTCSGRCGKSASRRLKQGS